MSFIPVRNTLLLLVLAGLAACSSAPKKGTLGALSGLPIKIDKDAPINSARDKAVASYWEFMNNAPQDSLKVEALRRLADLELQKSEESLQTKLASISRQQDNISLEDEEKLRGVSYEKAIKLYEDAVVAADKAGRQVDPGVLYQLSKAYEETGNLEKSLVSMDRLLTRYPAIDNRDELHFRRGELNFKLGRFKQAELAYAQAMVVSPSSPYYRRALSKRGWTLYKQHQYEKGLFSFFSVLSRYFVGSDGNLKKAGLKRGDQEFRDDTLRAIVLSFNEMGGPEAISKYLKEHGSLSYEHQIYLNLGNFYLDKQRFYDAKQTFDEYARFHPMDPKAPLFELKGIEAISSGGFTSALLQAKTDFSKKYRVGGDFWKAMQPNVQAALIPLLSQNVEDIARYYHSQAQKNHQARAAIQAQYWYRQYLEQFPNAPGAKKIHFLLAENLFENKSYAEAADEYEKTAYQYKNEGLDAEAAYASLLAYTKHVERLTGTEKEKWSKTAIAGALRFAKAFPEDKRSPQVLTKAAEDLFALKKYDQAAVAANNLIGLSSATRDMQRIAWTIVAKADFEKKHYSAAETSFRKALDYSEQPERSAELKANIAAAIYGQGDELRKTGNNAKAVEQFKRLAEQAPDSEFNRSARFDMATALLADKRYAEAVDVLLAFRRDYSNDALALKVSNNLAIAYNNTGQPVQAAQELEYLMRAESQPDKKRDMAWQIANIYENAKMQQETLDSYLYYVNNFAEPVEPAVEAEHKVAEIYLNKGDQERYNFWLNDIIRRDSQAAEQRTDRTKFLAANATFILAEPKLQQYNAIQLKAPLKTNLSLKKKRMQEAVDAYTQAANYGIADVTTAAYFQLGQIYRNFSKELLGSERPPGLSGDALEQYDLLLEEQAYPFEEKSISLHEENVKLIREGLYDEWVKKSFSELRQLNPVRYSKEERRDIIAGLLQ